MSDATYRIDVTATTQVIAPVVGNGLTARSCLTIADALVRYALSPDSDDTRIRYVIEALREMGYTETAATMERIQNDAHSVKA